MHEEETNWALISITLRYWFKKAWGVKKVYCRFKQRVLVQIVQVFPVRVAIGLRCKAKLAKFLLKISKIETMPKIHTSPKNKSDACPNSSWNLAEISLNLS